MLPILVLGLPVALLVIGMILMVMFLDVALLRPAHQTHSAAARQFPILEGPSLRRWAEDYAATTAARHLKRSRSASQIAALAEEIETALSSVLEWTRVDFMADTAGRCRGGRKSVSATMPEVLAISDELRHKKPQVVNRILERAQANAAGCPLLNDEGRCEAFAVRPLHCRMHCPACMESGESQIAGDDPFAITLGEGMTRGLSRGLAAAGLDPQLYDLNTALASVLKTPAAS
jgi:Fe-S-cluster containining protein